MTELPIFSISFKHRPIARFFTMPLCAAMGLATVLLAGQLHAAEAASLRIDFVESAPKDRFSITNTGNSQLDSFDWLVDLSSTYGKLIFDTTASGQGVEVYQPFEVRSGEIQLTSGTRVLDGDTTLSVTITNLAPGQTASFTIDVDDTRVQSELGQIRVSGAEISGALVRISNIQQVGQLPGSKKEVLASIDNSGSVSVTIGTGK